MAETIGSLADKLSIIQLKVFHMREQLLRSDVDQAHLEAARQKLAIMETQRADLAEELAKLFSDVASGKVRLKIYRQFKMYNDPRYRSGPKAA